MIVEYVQETYVQNGKFKEGGGYHIVLSLLNLNIMSLMIDGALLGSMMGLVFQARKFSAHHRKCAEQIGEVKAFLYGHVRNLESRLMHLQAVIQAQTDLKDVSEDCAERPNVCFNGGKLD